MAPPAWLSPLSDPAANAKLLALSAAQMLSSVATLMHDTYLPLYMRDVLGLSNTSMGNLHGLLQFLSRASGIISGRLADVLTPTRMVLAGVALTALCKPLFGLAGAVQAAWGTTAAVSLVYFAKIADRTIKGIRETPSKVLVAELAAASGDPAAGAYSLRQSLSTLGMLLGSGAASLAFNLSGRSYVATFALSAVVALLPLALVVSAFGWDGQRGAERACKPDRPAASAGLSEEDAAAAQLGLAGKLRALVGALGPAYWQALGVVMILYTARFDMAFIAIHASAFMDPSALPMLTPLSMVPVVLLAAPLGMKAKESVRLRNRLLFWGIAVLLVGDLCFAFVPSVFGVTLASLCVGVHMAMTQGLMFGMLASYIPSAPVPGVGRVSGTVWSISDLLLGVALAWSNTLAGRLSDLTVRRGMGATGCFLGGAAACAASMLALLLFITFGSLGREVPARAPATAGR